MKGKIDGLAIRVPTPDVSFTDLTVEVERPTTVAEVNAAFREAAAGSLEGILQYTEEELVSVDYIGNPYSCILDSKTTNRRRRHAGEGFGLVRQRVGLRVALRGHAALHGRPSLGATHVQKKTVRHLTEEQMRGKRALVRADFNVPLDENGEITDDTRIRAALPTLAYLLEHGARPVVLSHLGRPKGKPNPKYSLQPVAKRLAELMETPRCCSSRATDTDEAMKASAELGHNEILLLENTRFLGGGGGERPATRACARRARRFLRQRCVRRCAPRARFNGWSCGASAASRGRPADGARARLPRKRTRQSEAAVRRDSWRRERSPGRST